MTSYASKELIERAAAFIEWRKRTIASLSWAAPPELGDNLVRDLSKATPLPTDDEREAAIEAWLEEALSVEGKAEGSYIVTGDAINAICNLALRAPRPEPKPEPRASSALSTPPQPNHASGDRRLTAFLR